jgi:riboflavin kinase/FMN adenylyltransferase
VTFDPHPREFFNPGSAPPLLTTLEERERLLREFGIDLLARLRFDRRFADTSAVDFVRGTLLGMGDVAAMIVGYDFRFGKGREGNAALLARLAKEHGFHFEEMPPATAGGTIVKSTRIREAVAEGDLPLAATLLGRPYFVSGAVVHGAGRGRELGFATANLEPTPPRKLLPPDGVYAVRVAVEEAGGSARAGERARGVANLGTRPTFGGGARLLEVHLLDGQRDLYGARVRVDLVARLREERKFDGKEALIAQISQDVERARALLAAEP